MVEILKRRIEGIHQINVVKNVEVEACTDTLCRKCVMDKTVCTSYSNTLVDCLDDVTSICQSISSIVGANGCSTSNNTIEQCELYCLDCKTDSKICTLCDVANDWYILNDKCKNASTLDPGTGIDSINGVIKNCPTGQCVDFFANYSE